MSFGIHILTALAAMLALAGVAAAQCPECDPDGAAGSDGSYSSIDLGAIHHDGGAVADTDLSVADEGSSGFWAWLSVCLTVFIDSIEDLIGFDTGLQASADAYVSEDGIDLDAAVDLADLCASTPVGETVDCATTFDESPLGDLDGQTWQVAEEVHAAGAPYVGMPVSNDAVDGIDVDACLVAELAIASCG